MKRSYVDITLMSVLGMLAVAEILYSAIGGEPVFVVLLAIFLSVAVIIVGSIITGYRRPGQRRLLPVLAASVISLALLISVATTHWPLRATYAWSRNSFDTIAERVRNGEQIKKPMRVGLLTIQRAQLSEHGIVCLWLRPCLGGSTGFVQCRRDYVPFNLWSIIRLDDHWQFISED